MASMIRRLPVRQLDSTSFTERFAGITQTYVRSPDGTVARPPKQGRQDSNLQPPVLETGALPVELLP